VAAGLAFLFVGSIAPGHALAARPGGRAGRRKSGALVAVEVPRETSGNVLLRWRDRHTLSAATIRLNGRRVRDAPIPYEDGQRGVIPLDPADGLRFGHNRLVIQASYRRHRQTKLVRHVFVSRAAPLPAIVGPRDAVTGTDFRVDGRHSIAAHGGKLTYSWRVVRGPRGARARLRGAGSRRPQLIASVPGRYRLALTVTEAPRKGAGKTATASAVECTVGGQAPPTRPATGMVEGPTASEPLKELPPGALQTVTPGSVSGGDGPQASAGAGCATDVEAVDVRPNTKPIGVAFDSRAIENGQTGIRVGTEFIPLSPKGVTVALYEAETMEPLKVLQREIPPGIDAEQWGEGVADAYAPKEDVLIVVAGLPGCCSFDSEDSKQGFTLVENYTKNNGTATVNEGLPIPAQPSGATGQPGEMVGWLQPGIPLDGAPPLYTFVSSERVPFETSAPGPGGTSNTIAVDGHSYQASLPAGATAGFEVLVTNAALQPIDGTPTTFGTDSPQASLAAAQEVALNRLIAEVSQQQGSTLFMQSIGNPTPSTGTAASTARELKTIGASPWVFLDQNGSGPWSFVGNPGAGLIPGLQGTTAEASAQWSRQTGGPRAAGSGTLDGLLRRNELSAMAPQVADSVGTPNYELEQVTYQPSRAWPDSEGSSGAVTRWFARELRVGTGPGGCWEPGSEPEFWVVFCDQNENLANLRSEVDGERYPGEGSFGKEVEVSAEEFREVQAQLATELTDVETVRTLFRILRQPLGEQEPGVNANKIAGEIIEAIPSPKKSAFAGQVGLAGAIFDAGAYVPEVGEVLGPIGSILDLASALTQEEGQPSPEWQIQTAADAIGGQVKERLRKMTGELGATEEIIDSDWGKLSTTAEDAGSKWGVNQRELSAASSIVELGISQWMWTAIAPAAFNLLAVRNVPAGSAPEINCVAGSFYEPWKHASPESIFYPPVSSEGGRPTSDEAFGMLSGSYTNILSTPTAVSEALGEKMFGSTSQGGAALVAPWLFERAHWEIVESKYEKVQGRVGPETPPGWCGLL
jgi:hypothetical protein